MACLNPYCELSSIVVDMLDVRGNVLYLRYMTVVISIQLDQAYPDWADAHNRDEY